MKIFLGYPSEHEKTAWEIYRFLKAKGDEVWFDKVSLIAGVNWDNERDQGQREAELVIHLCSKAILERPGVVNREIKQTLRLVEDQPLGALYVIPISIEPMKMPLELTRFQILDFKDGWQERLSESVEKRRAQVSDNSQPPEQTVPDDNPRPPKQPVVEEKPLNGSQKIAFEDITKNYECRGEYIRYAKEGLYWTYVNGAIASHSLEGFYSAKSDFLKFSAEGGEVEDEGRWKSEWSINTEEFFRSGDMISLRFYNYIGYSGAAHPNHHITTLNFFGEDTGTLDIDQLLGRSPESAQKIITYCEKVIAAQSELELGGQSIFEYYKNDEADAWKLLAQFGFDRQGLTFNFSPYDVLPFAFGSHEVQVPWLFLDDMILDEYKDVVEKLIRKF